mgnify:CR=1 FL=1
MVTMDGHFYARATLCTATGPSRMACVLEWGSATSPRDRHPSELGTRPPSGWDPHESDVAGRGRPRCGPPGPLIRWGAAGALARAVRALRRRYMRQSRKAQTKLGAWWWPRPPAQRGAQALARAPQARKAALTTAAPERPLRRGQHHMAQALRRQGHCRKAHRLLDGSRAAGEASAQPLA